MNETTKPEVIEEYYVIEWSWKHAPEDGWFADDHRRFDSQAEAKTMLSEVNKRRYDSDRFVCRVVRRVLTEQVVG